jgi:FkbM family methyltransferase
MKEWAISHDLPGSIAALKAGLDAESRHLVDQFVTRTIHIPDQRFGEFFVARTNDLMTEEERALDKKVREHHRDASAQDAKLKDVCRHVLYFEHGLKDMPASVHESIAGGDFLDLGAYNGDSAYVLHKYRPRRIYSFDVSARHASTFRALMQQAGIENAELFQLALSNEDGTIRFADTGSVGTNIHRGGDTVVPRTTLDRFVAEHGCVPSLIKVDVEGDDLNTLIGAEKTIRAHRPVLSWSIYHNAEQFFRIKALLESWDLGYDLFIRRLQFHNPIADTTLIAYPKGHAPMRGQMA